jgi:hypothetical protein
LFLEFPHPSQLVGVGKNKDSRAIAEGILAITAKLKALPKCNENIDLEQMTKGQ